MKEITVETMIAACKNAPCKEEQNKLFDAFRTLRFYEIISGEMFDEFCELWNEEIVPTWAKRIAIGDRHFVKVKLEGDVCLTLYRDDEFGYSLEWNRRNKFVDHSCWLCEDKKRLSTINKYAAEYGIEFVA